MTSETSSKRVVIFSYHTMGFGARKASTVFWAEELAELGWHVDFVTAQLSMLSALVGVPRLKLVPKHQRNRWIKRTDRMDTFVWVPIFHPASTPYKALDNLATPLFSHYPSLLPETVRERVREAQLIIIESSSAVLLFPLLKRLAPKAKFVYRACDPLDTIGMHPMLSAAESETARHYDLFTSHARLILAPFPANVKRLYIPQGLEKSLFEASVPSPFENGGPHAIVAGDMMFDRVSLEIMIRNFPAVQFHTFGRMVLGDLASHPNVTHHGEVPFEALRDYILHADLGVAPYADRPDIHYLVESSLKLLQYTYARLPILAPYFCKGDRDHIKAYEPGDEASVVDAVNQALRTDRSTIDRSDVHDWHEIITMMLSKVGLSSPSARPFQRPTFHCQ